MENNSLLNVKRTYTCKEIATILGISKGSVYHLLEEEKRLKPIRIGKTIRISKVAFDAWLADFE